MHSLPILLIFNKSTDLSRKEIKELIYKNLGKINIEINTWIKSSDMTDQEKIENPNFSVQDGFLKCLTKEEVSKKRQEIYNKMSEEEKNNIKNLPNFDEDVFYDCTGIRV